MPINAKVNWKEPVFDEKRARSGHAYAVAKIAAQMIDLADQNNYNIEEYDTPDGYRHELLVENGILVECAKKLIHHLAELEAMQV